MTDNEAREVVGDYKAGWHDQIGRAHVRTPVTA